MRRRAPYRLPEPPAPPPLPDAVRPACPVRRVVVSLNGRIYGEAYVEPLPPPAPPPGRPGAP